MKSKLKERLLHDNIKYCQQIGIPLNHIPTVVFTAKEINDLYESRRKPGEHRPRPNNNRLGCCITTIRAIFINGNAKYAQRKYPMRKKGWYRLVTKKFDYYEARHTLVHELVHYRFSNLRHGKQFEQRIKEIIQGRPFPTQ